MTHDALYLHDPGMYRVLEFDPETGHTRRRLEVWIARNIELFHGPDWAEQPWYQSVKAWLESTPHELVRSEQAPPTPDTPGTFFGGHDYLVYEAV